MAMQAHVNSLAIGQPRRLSGLNRCIAGLTTDEVVALFGEPNKGCNFDGAAGTATSTVNGHHAREALSNHSALAAAVRTNTIQHRSTVAVELAGKRIQ